MPGNKIRRVDRLEVLTREQQPMLKDHQVLLGTAKDGL